MMLPPLIPIASTTVGRFLAYIEQHEGCWIFDGALGETGYAKFCFGGKKVAAHRMAYELFNGAIPASLHVLHKCDVRNCVNPEHLWLGTHSDNMRDMTRKGRRRGPQGEEHTSAILTAAQVREIAASDEVGTVLARRYGVTKGAIYGIRNGLTWKGITHAAA